MKKCLQIFFLSIFTLMVYTIEAQPTLDAHLTNDTMSSNKIASPQKNKRIPYEHQLKLAFDISKIPLNFAFHSKQSYEIQADYLLRNDVYINAEGGFGKGIVDYDNLKYTTNSYFIKAGIMKSMTGRISPSDFDMIFVGANYGLGIGKRSEATYTVGSPFGGEQSGIVPAQNFTAHWGELMAGIRVEFLPHFFAGWTVRGKFLLNGSSFNELSPNFIAGYGKAEKATIFDFNFYIGYAIRWAKPK